MAEMLVKLSLLSGGVLDSCRTSPNDWFCPSRRWYQSLSFTPVHSGSWLSRTPIQIGRWARNWRTYFMLELYSPNRVKPLSRTSHAVSSNIGSIPRCSKRASRFLVSFTALLQALQAKRAELPRSSPTTLLCSQRVLISRITTHRHFPL